ncbi:MAG TPA: hypothetical protein VF638_00995 [Sphingomonas sp.]|jgi:hypothetical protein
MGLSSSKSTSKTNETATVAPSSVYQPYINNAADQLLPGFNAATANNASLMPRVNGALDYSQSVLNGDYLKGNPYLDGVVSKSNADITTGVDSRFSSAGRYGSGMHAGILARSLADNENQLRYQNYATERGYQNAAPGQIAGLTGVSAALPQAASGTYADQINALLGKYTTGTSDGTNVTKSSPSILSMLIQAGNNAAKAAAGGG